MKQVHPNQHSQYASPWSISVRVKMLLWEACWTLLCSWTPKPMNPWRLFILRLFGARIKGNPFVHQRARIKIPWNLTLQNRACLGDRANAYSLGSVNISEGATIAQEAYLCTGTHDFANPSMPLQVGAIKVGKGAFVGARAMVLPDVSIAEYAVVGAQSVVTHNVPAFTVVAGNPARVLREQKTNGDE